MMETDLKKRETLANHHHPPSSFRQDCTIIKKPSYLTILYRTWRVIVYNEEDVNRIMITIYHNALTLSSQKFLSYRNQSTDFPCKPIDRFLYDTDLRYERVSQIVKQ